MMGVGVVSKIADIILTQFYVIMNYANRETI